MIIYNDIRYVTFKNLELENHGSKEEWGITQVHKVWGTLAIGEGAHQNCDRDTITTFYKNYNQNLIKNRVKGTFYLSILLRL